MSWREIVAMLGLGVMQPVEGPALAPADGPIFVITDYADDSTAQTEGWFSLIGIRQRVRLPDGADRETFVRLLAAASDSRVSLRLRLDASGARLSADGSVVEFPLCSLGTASGASFGDEARNCPTGTSNRRGAAHLLAIGIAQSAQHHEAARRTLSEALAAVPALPPSAQALAHNFRGEAAEALAEGLGGTTPAYDRLIAEALADYRRWQAVRPNDAQAHYAVARALLMLGGYDDALRIYQEIGRRWPEEAFDVAIRTGALYRQRADYPRALRQLDDYARDHPVSASGMRFSYHRAWTLTLLGRLPEAEREIERGMASQPDYSSAYQLRACIRARLGRLADALADQERALELLGGIMAQPSAAILADLERGRAAAGILRRAMEARQPGPITAPCETFWDRWSRPRPRSALLAAPTTAN